MAPIVMIDGLKSHYENKKDERVLSVIIKFLRSCMNLDESQFIPGRSTDFDSKLFIQYDRAGDMLPHIYWAYKHTGELWLLDLAERFYQRVKPPVGEWLDDHVVHFTQRFNYPGLHYILALPGLVWKKGKYVKLSA
jgi:hypothetical protein